MRLYRLLAEKKSLARVLSDGLKARDASSSKNVVKNESSMNRMAQT